MRRLLMRGLSFVTAVSVLICFTGCGKKKPQATVSSLPSQITAEMPWYDGKITEVRDVLDANDFELIDTKALGIINDRVVLCTGGQYLSSPSRFSTAENEFYLSVFDMEGEYLYDTDMYQAIRDYDPQIDGMYIQAAVPAADLIRLTVYNITTFSSPYVPRHEYIYFDPVTNNIVSEEDMNTAGFEPEYANFRTENAHYSADGYEVSVFFVSPGDGMNDYHFRIISPDGTDNYYKISELIPGMSISAVDGFLYLGNGKFVFRTMDYSFDSGFIYIDANTSDVQLLDNVSELAWLRDIPDISSFSYCDGFGNVCVTMDGIEMIDIERQCVTKFLSFDDCDINRYDITYMEIVYADPDKIILCGSVPRELANIQYAPGCNEPSRYDTQIVLLKRADSNPHAGKTVITAASMDSLSYPMAEAIRMFNETSTDSFIMMDPRYRYETLSEEVLFEDDMDEESYELAVKAAMMSRLSIDLMAGEGPDLIIGAMDFPQIDNPDMLLDLREDANAADVYDNIIDMSLTNGSLYQVPLSFALDGILSDRAYTGDQIGFDFESYEDYVNGPCNGRDPNKMTRLTFLCTCLSQMSDTFSVDGGYDYNREEFADVAEFVNGLILPEDLEQLEMEMLLNAGPEDGNPFESDFVRVCSGKDLLAVTSGQIDEHCIMGFPSSYPRGLMVEVRQSIAVSAGTSSPDACRRFVRMLVSDEYQELFAKYAGISLNRNAQETACRGFGEEHNHYYESLCEIFTPQELDDNRYPLCTVSADDLVSMMDGYIVNASGLRHTDAAVEIIVREEMQPYFAGDSSIERVMEVIQNRVNTFVNERG